MRALLSVYDKSGIVELARELAGLGVDLVSSGGTAAALRDAGLTVTDLSELTGFDPILGHRVVTLHPKVHGGILADPSDPAHQADMAAQGIEPFDLVVVNVYPFGIDVADFAHGGAGAEDVIDIGGPAMIRAAAKNHASVAVLTDPADYPVVLDELRADGRVSAATRRRLARTAFALTAAYDAAVAAWFDEPVGTATTAEAAPRRRRATRPRTTVVPSCRRRSTWPTAASRWPSATARTPTSGPRCTGPPAAPGCRRATPSPGGPR